MASINSVSGSNTISSLYNSGNIISGLASGLDTESMIENLVKSYQTKIQGLTNKATKIEWKQEAYRSIINKMYAFSNKYASYSSATNLLSSSFFKSAIKVAAMGDNSSKVTASGRTESDVKINSVKQLATAARYNTQSSLKGVDSNFAISAEKAVKFTDEFDTSALSGSMILNYGSTAVSLVFDPNEDIIDDYVYETNADGSYKLNYDGQRIVMRERTAEEKAADLQALIEKKLGDSTITLSSGESKKASELISVKRSGGTISFSDKSKAGNNVYISAASGTVESTLGIDTDNKPTSFSIDSETRLIDTQKVGSYISGATMSVSLDGKVKTIQLPGITTLGSAYMIRDESGSYVELTGDKYAAAVQAALDKEYGAGKIKVTNEADDPNSLKLNFKAPDNSDLVINTDVGKALGIDNIASNYLNTNGTLGDLMEEGAWKGLEAVKGSGSIIEKSGKWYDSKGREVDKEGYLLDSSGNKMYEFKLNGATIGTYSKDTKLSAIMNDINNNAEANVKVSYSQTTRQFSFVSKDTGSENKIELGEGLAQAIFGTGGKDSDTISDVFKGVDWGKDTTKHIVFETDEGDTEFDITADMTMEDIIGLVNENPFGYKAEYDKAAGKIILTGQNGNELNAQIKLDGKDLEYKKTASYVPGQDAVFTVEVNGQELEMTRGSNSANIDGLTVTFKDTFNEDYEIGGKLETEAVTFQTSTDSDAIVDAIKNMITDYNEMMAEIKSAYGTLPYTDSNGAFKSYEPLSDEDKATMSESAIQNYEAKAKQGILFNDYNLSSLYSRLQEAFKLTGEDGALLNQMGISWTYSTDGTSYIALDESKLRDTLDSNPDAVADLFTRSVDTGGTSNGIMQSMKTHLDRYGSVTGAVKGILVEQAGTPLSSLSLLNNEWQKQIDNLGSQIERWQDKLSTQVDKYTSMFSRLEVLMNQMNSQSSTLASLMG